ncbi:Uncharacterised protein [Mycobacteroides abscessus subsp. abscessus]|nr:Uncharacterised protein [Mycobacteroides abscessus subsp. abscessus]
MLSARAKTIASAKNPIDSTMLPRSLKPNTHAYSDTDTAETDIRTTAFVMRAAAGVRREMGSELSRSRIPPVASSPAISHEMMATNMAACRMTSGATYCA